mmetsp:Transcript_40769/g.110277  ORF Transcript_40769/g.110277 Transcript_40769/m.110277 type:complete len:860 (-) Transcript_40769:99-2678(-)|eukprot:CAMPEP_0171177768 /NCGR_PEP_ID=MMETSP0790-20130122/12409_1 /TAXON_ID=2925 /ORGANISM="Alexandrium catenella, Strain OF101" /LENGTH=859 /DNA_ID=CAMNT_0011642675 /DNA_START=50 /DNA_END=2629 /DNA_ORIENTATION=-
MAPAVSVGSLKTEQGLAKLNEHLADRSFVGGNAKATGEDLALFAAIHQLPDRQQLPHLLRWYRQIAALKKQFPDYNWSSEQGQAHEPAAKKGRAPGKEKQQLSVDCRPVAVPDRLKPALEELPASAGSSCLPGSATSPEGRYYITTAINYCNGFPHMGHAYEGLTADVFARYHRLLGQDVFFQTGADEHGQKIAQTAEGEGLSPIEICDRYCLAFQALNQRLHVSNDFYVRTTEERHKAVAQAIWKKCKEAGDIYLDRYEGWYLVREERFITDQEAQEWDFKDPGSGVPLKKMSEPSFFFRLSKYQKAITKLFEEHPEFIQPAQYRGEITERLAGMELRDLSISRGTFDWGVPCPEDEVDGKKHVMYVWFDALINYISGINGTDPSKPLSRFWPADMHIVGKDISWFHTVIWPAMLMSAGIPLPKSVVVHGFIAGADGRKMSKSYGNSVNAHDIIDKLPSDTFRWYLCRESQYGDDIKFSEDSLRLMHNADLCNGLGNLVNRAVNLCGGTVPDCDASLVPVPFDLAALKASVREAFNNFRLSEAADLTIRACGATNKWIADLEPWKMKADKEALKAACLRLLLEAVYVLSHFFAPFIPLAAEAIFQKLSTPPRPIPNLADSFLNLTVGAEVRTGSILFEQLEVGKAEGGPEGGKEASKAAPEAKAKAKAEAKDKAKAKAKAAPAAGGADQPLFSKLDVRVGRVVKAWHHPDADRLFVEEIDIGEASGPRKIVSGLREHYKLEEFEGRKLLVVANMKPAKLVGVVSSGMVLCAKNPEKKVVELLDVPDDLAIGERVLPKDVPSTWEPLAPEQAKKQKVWETVAQDLRTNADRVACFAGVPLTAAGGAQFLAPTQSNAEIS